MVYCIILKYTNMAESEPFENTTIKLKKDTKLRLDSLREYKRETYEEIIQKMLEIFNICRINPDLARSRLIGIERKKRIEKKRLQKQPRQKQPVQ